MELELDKGTVLDGKYAIEAPLDAGGFGVVYLAQQLSVKRRVVLKLVHPSIYRNPTVLPRFRREIEICARLRHPHTVQLIDTGEHAGVPFLVMEYIEGRTLHALVAAEGALPPLRVARLLSQILESIAEAHGLGIVHRDLKPGNVLLTQFQGAKDFVKVIDFGLARLVDVENTRLTAVGAIPGTMGYLAPEVARGEEARPGSDLYAVGLIGHELLTGKPVFDAPTPMGKLIQQAQRQEKPAPPELARHPIYPVILRLMAFDPGARYPTALAALAALRTVELGPLADTLTADGAAVEARALHLDAIAEAAPTPPDDTPVDDAPAGVPTDVTVPPSDLATALQGAVKTLSDDTAEDVLAKLRAEDRAMAAEMKAVRAAVHPPPRQSSSTLLVALLLAAVLSVVALIAWLLIAREPAPERPPAAIELAAKPAPVDSAAAGPAPTTERSESAPNVQPAPRGDANSGADVKAARAVTTRIVSEPSGASVYLGEQRLGETPLDWSYTCAGEARSLSLELDKHVKSALRVECGQAEAVAKLSPIKGKRPDRRPATAPTPELPSNGSPARGPLEIGKRN